MANAPGAGTETLRDLEGTCDWCGDDCHPNNELCVVMSCNRCDDPLIYHQGCLEKFLKKYGFPSNRKVGFPCPKGRGKGTLHTKECPGRIDRSHPIIPKNEDKKKKAMPPPMAEVMGKPATKQPAGKQHSKVQQAAKPGLPARKLAHPKPYELSMRFSASTNSVGPVPNAWHRAEGVNLSDRTAPVEPAEPAYLVAGSDQPKPASVPVGLVLEEALTKAQRKNLARRKKKQQAATADGQHSEAGTTATDGSADLNSLDDWAAAEQRQRLGGCAQADENLLAGHNKFVTDPARYLQLLGLLSDDSDADSDGEGDQDCELSPAATQMSYLGSSGSVAASVDAQSAASTGDVSEEVPVVMPVSVPLVLPKALQTATSVAPAVPAVSSLIPAVMPTGQATNAIVDDDAALLEALALSRKEYEFEQEVEKQRLVLAGGALGPTLATCVELAPQASKAVPTPLSFNFPQTPSVEPPISGPLGHDNTAIGLPFELGKLNDGIITYGGYGRPQETMTGLPGASHIGPMPSKALSFSRPTAGYAPMAASHQVSTMASCADDDGLTDLLALCGVAG